ncbi:MAG TPA: transglutaminase domain-containing protein, partial [Cystobacter sp.]
MLLPVLLLALPARGDRPPAAATEQARFVFAWKGVPVGLVTLSLSPEARRFTYTSRHLHTRAGHVGQRTREEAVTLGADGAVAGRSSVSQALWLWHKPPSSGCVLGREELSGREGPHCVTLRLEDRVEGTLLGQPFLARYDSR